MTELTMRWEYLPRHNMHRYVALEDDSYVKGIVSYDPELMKFTSVFRYGRIGDEYVAGNFDTLEMARLAIENEMSFLEQRNA